MNKTRVDDMLIEMIKPKLEEIEKKFTSGGSLTQDDINTLLLKSQYNHINHLDIKLDETVESVKRLETEFKLLKQELTSDVKHSEERLFTNMDNLKEDIYTKMDDLKEDMNDLRRDIYAKMDNLKEDMDDLRKDIYTKMDDLKTDLYTQMDNLKTDLYKQMDDLKKDVYTQIDSIKKELHHENQLLRAEFEKLKEEINVTIQTALNKNMMMLIVIIGFFLTLSKVIDHIFK